jgi:uncharacterized protein (DUF1697 family)
MKYVALLRGINVGGNNLIKMTDLKRSFENCGFEEVITYIQSGNVIFKFDEIDISSIDKKIKTSLLKDFNYNLPVIIKNHIQMKIILADVPSEWKNSNDLRCYIAFAMDNSLITAILSEIKLKEGIDFLKTGEGVLYMSTVLSGITKSAFSKLLSSKIYKEITIRNFNTSRKLLELMDE